MTVNYKYYICDVFTTKRFGGNPLAVLPDAEGLTAKQMQQIAKEFNFSESAFVFPPENGNIRKIRIFTPTIEVPFAGHPNIGTAFVLASTGIVEEFYEKTEIVFEEKAGLVPITLRKLHDGVIWCELQSPENFSIGNAVSVDILASAISLTPDKIITNIHFPRVFSVGLPFLIAELTDRNALEEASVNSEGFKKLVAQDIIPYVHVYTRSNDEFDIRARMFAPFEGVPEDPATGSANCALGGLLAYYDDEKSGNFEWKIAQGIEMGRPSSLKARTQKKDGKVISTYIGGSSVMVSEGVIYVD
ncbi:MAG: PhzF family phenazine biosynthesis protein [SAR324 cluster bacterium]